MTDSGLAAIDRQTGQVRWFARFPGLGGSQRVLVRGGRVVTAASTGVQAHDAVTGTLLWQRAYDPVSAYPARADLSADDTDVYVGLSDGRTVALALSDGHVVWEAQIATAEWVHKGTAGGSTIAGDTLFVGATRFLTANAFEEAAVIVALDRRSGRELWRYQSPGIETSIGHAVEVVGPNLIFTDGYRGYVVAVDRATHAERWRQLMHGFFFHGPVVRDGKVFAATAASRAYAIDASSGATLWTATLEAGATSVGLCRDELFVGNFHVEVRSASDGSRIGLAFTSTGEETVTSRIDVAGDVVYVGTNKRLMALRCQ